MNLPDVLSLLAGAVLSLAFAYVPGVSGWFGALDAVKKRGVMALALLAAAGLLFVTSCAGLPLDGANIECSSLGAWSLVKYLLLALAANQSAYQLSPASRK